MRCSKVPARCTVPAGRATLLVAMHVNFYAGSGLDRSAHVRRDADWLERALHAPSTRLVPVWRSQSLVEMGDAPTPVWLDPSHLETLAGTSPMLAFMGVLDEIAHFALDISHLERPEDEAALRGAGQFVDLRNAGALLDRTSGSLLAYARGLMYWHARHRHCGVCGHPTLSEDAGHVRTCTNAACKAQHFPRTDPAVIMLVTHGDHCLLGRQKMFLPGMHSTLAGFVEPGESLEEAVAREVFEETGVRVVDVRYHSSQPWPFPGSIMLGFHARALGTALDIDTNELESASWFSRDALRASPENDTFRLPRKVSIARQLVEHWMNEG